MNLSDEFNRIASLRAFLTRGTTGLGAMALASLFNRELFAASAAPALQVPGALKTLHFAPRAKHVIFDEPPVAAPPAENASPPAAQQ